MNKVTIVSVKKHPAESECGERLGPNQIAYHNQDKQRQKTLLSDLRFPGRVSQTEAGSPSYLWRDKGLSMGGWGG